MIRPTKHKHMNKNWTHKAWKRFFKLNVVSWRVLNNQLLKVCYNLAMILSSLAAALSTDHFKTGTGLQSCFPGVLPNSLLFKWITWQFFLLLDRHNCITTAESLHQHLQLKWRSDNSNKMFCLIWGFLSHACTGPETFKLKTVLILHTIMESY
jgi:hypothetical protein